VPAAEGREAYHTPPSSGEVKNAWRYTSIPQYAFMAWCSVKEQGQVYLYRYVTLKQIDGLIGHMVPRKYVQKKCLLSYILRRGNKSIYF
jgi:hypothetical protein